MDKRGLFVIYLDERKQAHHALITNDFNTTMNGPVNLVFVTTDIDKQDSYGMQLERRTSVAHISQGYEDLRANCWIEDPNNKLPT